MANLFAQSGGHAYVVCLKWFRIRASTFRVAGLVSLATPRPAGGYRRIVDAQPSSGPLPEAPLALTRQIRAW